MPSQHLNCFHITSGKFLHGTILFNNVACPLAMTVSQKYFLRKTITNRIPRKILHLNTTILVQNQSIVYNGREYDYDCTIIGAITLSSTEIAITFDTGYVTVYKVGNGVVKTCELRVCQEGYHPDMVFKMVGDDGNIYCLSKTRVLIVKYSGGELALVASHRFWDCVIYDLAVGTFRHKAEVSLLVYEYGFWGRSSRQEEQFSVRRFRREELLKPDFVKDLRACIVVPDYAGCSLGIKYVDSYLWVLTETCLLFIESFKVDEKNVEKYMFSSSKTLESAPPIWCYDEIGGVMFVVLQSGHLCAFKGKELFASCSVNYIPSFMCFNDNVLSFLNEQGDSHAMLVEYLDDQKINLKIIKEYHANGCIVDAYVVESVEKDKSDSLLVCHHPHQILKVERGIKTHLFAELELEVYLLSSINSTLVITFNNNDNELDDISEEFISDCETIFACLMDDKIIQVTRNKICIIKEKKKNIFEFNEQIRNACINEETFYVHILDEFKNNWIVSFCLNEGMVEEYRIKLESDPFCFKLIDKDLLMIGMSEYEQPLLVFERDKIVKEIEMKFDKGSGPNSFAVLNEFILIGSRNGNLRILSRRDFSIVNEYFIGRKQILFKEKSKDSIFVFSDELFLLEIEFNKIKIIPICLKESILDFECFNEQIVVLSESKLEFYGYGINHNFHLKKFSKIWNPKRIIYDKEKDIYISASLFKGNQIICPLLTIIESNGNRSWKKKLGQAEAIYSLSLWHPKPDLTLLLISFGPSTLKINSLDFKVSCFSIVSENDKNFRLKSFNEGSKHSEPVIGIKPFLQKYILMAFGNTLALYSLHENKTFSLISKYFTRFDIKSIKVYNQLIILGVQRDSVEILVFNQSQKSFHVIAVDLDLHYCNGITLFGNTLAAIDQLDFSIFFLPLSNKISELMSADSINEENIFYEDLKETIKISLPQMPVRILSHNIAPLPISSIFDKTIECLSVVTILGNIYTLVPIPDSIHATLKLLENHLNPLNNNNENIVSETNLSQFIHSDDIAQNRLLQEAGLSSFELNEILNWIDELKSN
ncbi:hypothetical protein ROZALSC1DRAFT_28344 [Rozella allomycis CSF55]|uniref:RSE1/DDB1/CPSF1 C-terminal domain-containing protein n=1 Tax=Rozella allomycis (strain CSF55) TaxID=988480 RepID=A0A4P9YKY9_ROZAC|nr:hypothetical protein ROZALSC1DRAFT_28344 [Rozella allomycis CSF55]